MKILDKKSKNGLYIVDYFDTDGIQHKKAISAKYTVALAFLNARIAARDEAKLNPKAKTTQKTFDELAPLFIEKHINNLPSKKSYLSMFNEVMIHFKDKKVSEIKTLDIHDYYINIIDKTSASTANRYLGIISKFFSCLIDWDMYWEINPCSKVKKHHDNVFKPNPLSEEEMNRLMEYLSARIKPCIVCGLYTGLRRQELLGLRWEHLNFENKTIFIPKTKTQKARTIGLTEDLIQLFTTIGIKKEGRIFEEITNGQLRYQLQQASKRAGLKHFRPHDMRHTACVAMINRGNRPELVQRILGHSNLKTTQKYMQFKTGEIAQHMEVLNGMIPLSTLQKQG